MKEWSEQRVKLVHSKKKPKELSKSNLKDGVRTNSKTRLPKVEDSFKKPAPALAFYIYLPDGSKTYPFEKQKDSELGELLDKIVKNRGDLNPATMGEPLDSEGNPLDRKKLKDLSTLEVSYGITLRAWTLNAAAETIKKYLVKEGTITSDKAFKVYLPQGQVSSSAFLPKKNSRKFCTRSAKKEQNLLMLWQKIYKTTN